MPYATVSNYITINHQPLHLWMLEVEVCAKRDEWLLSTVFLLLRTCCKKTLNACTSRLRTLEKTFSFFSNLTSCQLPCKRGFNVLWTFLVK